MAGEEGTWTNKEYSPNSIAVGGIAMGAIGLVYMFIMNSTLMGHCESIQRSTQTKACGGQPSALRALK